jgi:hypothetical protein
MLVAATLPCLCGCDKTEDVPAYLEIPAMVTSTQPGQGDPTSNITDIRISAAGKNLGVWELPARIPVMATGTVDLEIQPSIKRNGMFDDRLVYPFYTIWQGTIDLAPSGTSTLTPQVGYRNGISFWLEPFDAAGTLLSTASNLDTLKIFTPSSHPQLVRDGSPVGAVTVTAANSSFRLLTDEDFPLASGPVFLEMDYSSDIALTVGVVYVNSGQPGDEGYITFIPTTDNGNSPFWKKAYVDDLSAVFNIGTISIRDIYIEGNLQPGRPQGLALFDNLKIVRFQ